MPGQNKTSHAKSRQSNLTLFTPDSAEYTSNLDLKIHNNALPMATHPNVLGFTLDPKLTYSTHIHNISVHAHKPLQIIKSLTATRWGKQKETLMAAYKAVMRPALEYASSIWSPLASSTSINKLQDLQLHTSQYKQKTQHPSHPLHKHTTYFNTPRLKTLFLTTAASQQTFPRAPHSHYNRQKQTCAIYIHLLSLGI